MPKDKVARLRMKLAESGLPKGGGVGYEIFDKSDALGSTTFVQNINHLRALEGELARTIRGLDRVQAARVHLVLPDRPLFSRDKTEPSASIVLKVRGTLEPQQVRAIRHLVATAVSGLEARARVGDRRDRQAARRRRRADRSAEGAGADERKAAYEKRLREQVETIVILGGRARPRARGDHRRFRPQPHHPDLRQVRSRRPRGALEPDPRGKLRDRRRKGRAGIGRQRTARRPGKPGSPAAPADQNRKTEEIVNYEISRTTKTEVTEAGRVNRISAAVLVDGIYTKNDKGEVTYQPRAKEEIDRIAALVRIGHRLRRQARRSGRGGQPALRGNAARADQRADRLDELPAIHQGRHHALRRAGRDGAARPGRAAAGRAPAGAPDRDARGRDGRRPGLRRGRGRRGRGCRCDRGQCGRRPAERCQHDAQRRRRCAPQCRNIAAIAGAQEAVAVSNRTSAMIDVAQVQGQVHAQSVEKVGELAEKNPHRGGLHRPQLAP